MFLPIKIFRYRYKVPNNKVLNHRISNHKVLITKFLIDKVPNHKVPDGTNFLITKFLIKMFFMQLFFFIARQVRKIHFMFITAKLALHFLKGTICNKIKILLYLP